MEFWISTIASPTRSAGFAAQAEAEGWDGMLVVDSQNLSGDPYVALAMAATGSKKLGLQTSVTNPVTRHPAVTASSALSVQKLSKGRMVLGIGRGDSALAHLGHAPAKLSWFETYLENLQAYLRGDEVPFDATGISNDVAAPIDDLKLGDAPRASSIKWVGEGPKVPVEVAATGAKVIGMSARHADRIMFALGADPKRLSWGIDTARQAAEEAGRDPSDLKYGAYVSVVCHDDLEVAREMGRATTGLFARFSVMHGKVSGPADDNQKKVFEKINKTYDMNKHAQPGGKQTEALSDAFMDQFAIIGSASHCFERLQEIGDMGIEKVAISGPNFTAKNKEAQFAAEQFAGAVMPQLRG